MADADASFRKDVFRPWNKHYVKSALPLLEQKVDECFAYRGQSADDLFNNAMAIPRRLNDTEDTLVSGMLGRGIVDNPVYNNVTYDGMRFEGYTLPETGPIYYGKVLCQGTLRKVAGPGRVKEIFPSTDLDACAPTTSPTPAPTLAPTRMVSRYFKIFFIIL